MPLGSGNDGKSRTCGEALTGRVVGRPRRRVFGRETHASVPAMASHTVGLGTGHPALAHIWRVQLLESRVSNFSVFVDHVRVDVAPVVVVDTDLAILATLALLGALENGEVERGPLFAPRELVGRLHLHSQRMMGALSADARLRRLWRFFPGFKPANRGPADRHHGSSTGPDVPAFAAARKRVLCCRLDFEPVGFYKTLGQGFKLPAQILERWGVGVVTGPHGRIPHVMEQNRAATPLLFVRMWVALGSTSDSVVETIPPASNVIWPT